MTERQAHEILHEALPKGGTVSISHNSWSHSTVGAGPVVHSNSWGWHVVVTVANEIDHHVEDASGEDLADAVSQICDLLRLHLHARPPKLAAPFVGLPGEEQKRDAS